MFNPVFICGCDRSGTTLLGSILGSHTKCVTTPESHFKINLLKRMKKKKLSFSEIVNFLNINYRFQIWNISIKNQLKINNLDITDFPKLMQFLIEEYANSVNVSTQFKSYWVDHTPNNSSFGLELLKTYPNAKFIHIIRDGRGVAASVLPLDWGPNTTYYASDWWRNKVSEGMWLERFTDKENFYSLKYENFLCEPNQELKKVCNFLNLDFEPSILSDRGLILPLYTKKQHNLVNQAVDQNNQYKWQTKLSNKQIEFFEHKSFQLLELLNYKPIFGLKANPPTKTEKLLINIKEKIKSITNLLKYRKRIGKFIK